MSVTRAVESSLQACAKLETGGNHERSDPPELIRRYADAIMIAIKADIDAGIVPRSVSAFAELHGYVDANEYTGQAGVPWGSDPEARRYGDDGYALINAVEAAVSAMLAVSNWQLRRRLPEATSRLPVGRLASARMFEVVGQLT
jgi:hypothetical protein